MVTGTVLTEGVHTREIKRGFTLVGDLCKAPHKSVVNWLSLRVSETFVVQPESLTDGHPGMSLESRILLACAAKNTSCSWSADAHGQVISSRFTRGDVGVDQQGFHEQEFKECSLEDQLPLNIPDEFVANAAPTPHPQSRHNSQSYILQICTFLHSRVSLHRLKTRPILS